MKKTSVIVTLLLTLFFIKTVDLSAKSTQIDTLHVGNTSISFNETELREWVDEQLSLLKESEKGSAAVTDAVLWESIIALVIPITFFIACFATVFIVFYYRRREREARYQLMEKAIEKGVQLPEHIFFTEKKEKKTALDYLKNGIICLVIGIAFLILWQIIGGDHWENFAWISAGLILFFIGLGNLVIAIIERVKENKEKENNNH